MKKLSAFVAYSSYPEEIGDCIEKTKDDPHVRHHFSEIESWRQIDIAGKFISQGVLEKLDSKECFVADISVVNFNVTYELGYAIGRGKKILLIRNSSLHSSLRSDINRIGIFDTIGYDEYQNAEELSAILKKCSNATPQSLTTKINRQSPLYFIDAEAQHDLIILTKSRIRKAGFEHFRRFDPTENVRMSAYDEIRNISESLGVVITLLSKTYSGYEIHNIRSAFAAGLAHGMEKETLILQFGEFPVPLDIRDFAYFVRDPKVVIDALSDFAPKLTSLLFKGGKTTANKQKESILTRLNLGASAAENEFGHLDDYYIETDAYRVALNGEVRIVLGRKGSGKTALFSQVEAKKSSEKSNVIVSLKPETYKLLKFKDEVLALLEEGTLEHTVMAFWEYIIYLELCYRVLKIDRSAHVRNHKLFEPYNKLKELFYTDDYVSEGDLSERISVLLQDIKNDFVSFIGKNKTKRLSRGEITDLLYKHRIRDLRDALIDYLVHKNEVIILIDNLDKGWNTLGVKIEDLVIIRTLLEATKKIENHLNGQGLTCNTLIFLRNDIYELLLSVVTDRGKDPKVVLDWTDTDGLREVIRKRIAVSLEEKDDVRFEELWSKIAESHVKGEESFSFLLGRCLMRPRVLIDMIKACRASAVNRGNKKISAEDFISGASDYSHTLIQEISLEIRDVFPEAEDILYRFIDQSETMTLDDIYQFFLEAGLEDEDEWWKLLTILVWYGVIGILKSDKERLFIYNVSYDMKIIMARIDKEIRGKTAIFALNPAFWAALETKGVV